jgi:hypothetical protein
MKTNKRIHLFRRWFDAIVTYLNVRIVLRDLKILATRKKRVFLNLDNELRRFEHRVLYLFGVQCEHVF